MRTLYYDCFSGISGDMNLGALVDLGVDQLYLEQELSKLNLNEYRLKIYKDSKMGIQGTRVDVILFNEEIEHHHHHGDDSHCHAQADNHKHDHSHSHDQEIPHGHEQEHHHEHSHSHEHNQGNEHTHNHSHDESKIAAHHRNLKDIEDLINSSQLSDKVKKLSIEIFQKVAEAEAKIHGKPLYEVHFHEVGAVDSIVDIVGAAICIDYLKVDCIKASTIEVGSGFVRCAHGVLPVPAPATAEILRGAPIKSERVPFEATTPTGAAILAALVEEYDDKKRFTPLKVAYGIGKKDGNIPNVLRVILSEEDEKAIGKDNETALITEALMLECNIDDMNPEIYEYVMEELFESGAQDAFLTPIIMKKGRPAVKLSVLCSEEDEDLLSQIIFKETTTLGIRKQKIEKEMLYRKSKVVNTDFGDIKVKVAYRNNEELKHKFEYSDCKKAAKESKTGIKQVYEAAENMWRNLKKE